MQKLLFCLILGTFLTKIDSKYTQLTNSSALLLDFSKKFFNIIDDCNEFESCESKFCSTARTDLLPILNNLLRVEKLKQDPVQKVLGNAKNCLIRNRQYPEYFYAAGDWLKQINHSENRLVLTWRPGWFDDECYWDIERVENVETDSDELPQYHIKNKKYGEYLHGAANLWHDDMPERRYVFSWRKHIGNRCEEQCLWHLKLIKTDESKIYFAIQNVETREYLYAMHGLTYETNSRYVFTQKYQTIMEQFEAHWIIDCK